MFRIFPCATVVGAALASGVLSGVWTQRWASSEGIVAAAERLTHLPLRAGAWEGRELPVSADEVQLAQAAGMIRRQYVHRTNGQAMTLLLVYGLPGPVSVHTPDVCYANSGYAEFAPVARAAVASDPPARFWVRRFRKQAAVPTQLRVAYAWSTGGAWEADDNPRVAYARSPALFKLYVVREESGADRTDADDPALDLLRELIPQLQSTLSPAT